MKQRLEAAALSLMRSIAHVALLIAVSVPIASSQPGRGWLSIEAGDEQDRDLEGRVAILLRGDRVNTQVGVHAANDEERVDLVALDGASQRVELLDRPECRASYRARRRP